MALKNYNEQLNNLKKCDARINELVDFSKKLNALSVTMQSVWECNTDRERIFESFNSLISSIDIIIDWFYKFRSRATIYLNKLNTLEWIVHGQYLPYKKEQASSLISEGYGSRKTRIQISVAEFDGFYTQLKKMADDLETVKKRTSNINNNIDVMIKKQFVNGEKTLTDIIKRLDMVKEHTIQAADAVKGVGEIYKQRETALKNFATQYMLKGQSSGEVSSSIDMSKKYDESYKAKVISGGWPTEKRYWYFPNVAVTQSNGRCTHASNVMMLRRAAIMRGDSNWENITEETTHSQLLNVSNDQKYDYTYNGFTGHHGYFSSSVENKKQQLIDLIDNHPAGVVIYDHNSQTPGGMHAILVTRYENGIFYGIDPAKGVIKEEVPIGKPNTLINWEDVETYWNLEGY